MAHHFRRPYGYWIKRFPFDLYDYYRFRKKETEGDDQQGKQQHQRGGDPRKTHPEKNDLVILYNDQHEIVCQREILSNGCQYFERLLLGSFKEAQLNRVPIHLLKYEDPKAFICMIDYIHTKHIALDKRNTALLIEVMEICQVFLFDELRNIIHKFLEDSVNTDTMLHILAAGVRNDSTELKLKCKEYNHKLMVTKKPQMEMLGDCPLSGHNHHYLTCKSRIPWRP